jgi:hypothetical protein
MRGCSQQLIGYGYLFGIAVVLGATLLGCGETGSPLGPPDLSVSSDLGVADEGTPGPDAATDASTDAATDAALDNGVTDVGVVVDSSGGGCPAIAGTYSLGATGPGCGALGNTQTITEDTPTLCVLDFVTAAALSGTVEVEADGSFIGQTLSVGGTPRSCRGTWNPTLAQFNIVCGSGPSVCNVTLD